MNNARSAGSPVAAIFWLAFLALPSSSVFAQSSIPESADETAAPDPPQTNYYKGKGPGKNNSYAERYEEDYAYLRDPDKSNDIFDPLKFIPLDRDGYVYLTLNGELRFRYDNIDHRRFGVAPSAVPATTPGGSPTYGTATAASTSELYRQRYMLGGDLHIGPGFRAYAEFYHGQETGHNVGGTVPGKQRNDVALVNGFAEFYGFDDEAKTGIRAGRQEVFLGNNLQVRTNHSPNLPWPMFDGFRAYRDWGSARVELFGYDIVNFANGVPQDRDNPRTNLWGVYGSQDLPPMSVAGIDMKTSLDLFYIGWRSSPFAGARGSGVYDDRALLTGAKIVASTGGGFLASQDHRHSFGLRADGMIAKVDYDWQAAVQTGSYAGLTVDAFAFNTDTGYAFAEAPWKPRIGVHVDAASGGADKNGGTISTYQPMYPQTQYYAPNQQFAPTNFYDFSPRLRLSPAPGLTIDCYYAFYWRYSEADAIYRGGWSGADGPNSYAVTVLSRGREIGRQIDLRLTWNIAAHVSSQAEVGIFYPGSALRVAGGKTTTYLNANVTYKF